MAITIFSEQYSFVQFYTTKGVLPYSSSLLNRMLYQGWDDQAEVPGNEIGWGLPVGTDQDIYFGVYVNATSEGEQALLCDLDVKTMCRIYLLLGIRDNAPTDSSFIADSPKNWPDSHNGGYQYVQKTRINESLFFFYWKWPLYELMMYALNKCFQLVWDFNFGSILSPDHRYVISNPMVGIQLERVPASPVNGNILDGYTTLLEYRSKIGDFGFSYHSAVDFSHRVRLPMFPNKPEYVDDEAVYVKSNGQRVFTKSNTYKRYTWNVDWLPEWAHEMLVAALKHETTKVYHSLVEGGIRKDGAYQIQQVEQTYYPQAPANFKAFITPFQMNMDTCGVNPNTYVPSNYNLNVDYVACGTQSFTLTGIVPPACDGVQYFELIYANPLYTSSAVVNNATGKLDVTMNNVTADIIIATIRVIHPLSDQDTITVRGFFASSVCI